METFPQTISPQKIQQQLAIDRPIHDHHFVMPQAGRLDQSITRSPLDKDSAVPLGFSPGSPGDGSPGSAFLFPRMR